MSSLSRCLVSFTILCVFSATSAADVFYDAYQRGLAAFKAKEYTNARVEFLRAYDLRREPVILFNVAQTYRLEHSSEQALDYYKRFLAESKIAADLRKDAEAYVADLEAEQAARDAQAKIDADAGPKERDGTPVKVAAPPTEGVVVSSSAATSGDTVKDIASAAIRESDGALTAKRKTASGPGSDRPESVPQIRSSASLHTSSRVAPLVVGAGALALLGSGLGLELWAESRYNAAKSEMTSQPRRASLYNSANMKRYVAEVLGVSGLAAGGAAVWLYLRGDNRERDAATNTSLHVVPTAAGLVLFGQF